jgi:hypothetical protein
MKPSLTCGVVLVVAAASFALGAETRSSLVESYRSLADTILGAKKTESSLVKAILETHVDAARRAVADGKPEEAAAHMALFANEGDNAVGGIRKRLLEGGHHHNAEGEAKGIYEPGYVIVTKAVKTRVLAASAAMQSAADDAARKAAWADFEKAAAEVVRAD